MNRKLKTYTSIHQFDFEVGYLVKSPCKDCETRNLFPRCIEKCRILDEIHTAVSNAVSCTRRV